MEETYITFEQSKELKKLGFPQDTRTIDTYYYDDGAFFDGNSGEYEDEHNVTETYVAPSLELASKWVRENTGIFIHVGLCVDFQYQVFLQTTLDPDHNIISSASQHSSYEEALSAGIDKTIEKLKEK